MRLRLSGQPFQVLAVLVERAGEVITREELHAKLWASDTFVDFDHGLNNAVARIREVLDDSPDAPRFVETIPRRGYRFIAPVSNVPSATATPSGQLNVTVTDSGALVPSPRSPQRRLRFAHLRVLLGGAAVLSVFVVAAVLLFRTSIAKPAHQLAIKSLAVLPLKNLSGDAGQEYLADAMTEAIIGRLSGIHNLRVISRTSVMRFKNTQLSVPDIGGTLRVEAVVEGSVLREGSRIRVYAQLIRADTDEHFWSETYDRKMGDVLALQSDIARSIAEKVEVTITGQEQSRLVAARYVSPEVYESYLKGEFAKGNSQADIEKTIGYFEQAISQDPTFAPAYVGLAKAYGALDTIFVGAPPAEVRPKIISAAQKALEMDSQLAEPHALLADVFREQWRWTDAEAEYKQALELNPNDAATHLGYADWLMCQGRPDEALAWARRARELDPLGVTGISIGWILFHARRYDEAIRELRSVVAVHPDYASAHYFLGFALIGKGQPGLAIPELEKTASLMHRSPGSIELLATAEARAGNRAEALRLINELKQRRQTSYVPAGALINPHLALGDYDEAFVWFERAYQEQSNILQFLKIHPFFDPVRQDRRFKDLQRRVGLN
ncbi:MAG TPA: tetratricopeptide repeat protein [Terriglobales bacterium]|nr:tetratricopeptide repeat protein [Terriglobales bacterium]